MPAYRFATVLWQDAAGFFDRLGLDRKQGNYFLVPRKRESGFKSYRRNSSF